MLRRFYFAFVVLAIIVHSVSYAVQPFKVLLKNGEIMILEMVEDTNTDVSADVPLGLAAFEGAFRGATVEELETHFGPGRDIHSYYQKLFDEDDVAPFHRGEVIWIRAFLNQRLVGWMTLLPHFRGPQIVYVSTLVVDPGYHELGIGRGMLASIRAHWAPDVEELDLVVRRINYEALPFYERIGFVPAPDIESDLVGDPRRCMFMRLVGHRLYNLLPGAAEFAEPGETTHVRLTLSDGNTLVVVNEHVMPLATGNFVVAAKLNGDDQLLKADGTGVEILHIVGFTPPSFERQPIMGEGLIHGGVDREYRDPSYGQNERALLVNPAIDAINAGIIADMLWRDLNSF
jgi:ribosomal protein S18 acetylase RimI-like enzyme